MTQGDVWWADLGAPTGSEPASRRPVVVMQCDAFNRSRIATVVCVHLGRLPARTRGSILGGIGVVLGR